MGKSIRGNYGKNPCGAGDPEGAGADYISRAEVEESLIRD
jgi:hypothetical protein